MFHESAAVVVDLFGDQFHEEELVLDRFVALAGIFHAKTPRVENRRDPSFARLVQNVLDSSAATPNDEEVQDNVSPDTMPEDRAPDGPSIRLAKLAEFESTPLSRTARPPEPDVTVDNIAVDVPSDEDDIVPLPREWRSAVAAGPSTRTDDIVAQLSVSCEATPAIEVVDADLEYLDDAADTILVIEDEPAEPVRSQPGVRREEYRQLFSRLRHGT
jgi:hypothetical protein